jgi:hypothetical protein
LNNYLVNRQSSQKQHRITKRLPRFQKKLRVYGFMVFNATINNISVTVNQLLFAFYISNQYIKKKYFYFQKIRGNNSHQNRKLSGALIISYVITCDIGFNSIHKYISRLKKCQYSVCNVLCKWIVMSVLSV